MTMNPAIKAQWIERLRSGEIEQGRGHLAVRYPEGRQFFCCLGVLTEIAVEHGVIDAGREEYEYNVKGYVKGYPDDGNPEDAVLPRAVYMWAGLPDANPNVKHDLLAFACLATLNDRGVPFAEIADLIEEQF